MLVEQPVRDRATTLPSIEVGSRPALGHAALDAVVWAPRSRSVPKLMKNGRNLRTIVSDGDTTISAVGRAGKLLQSTRLSWISLVPVSETKSLIWA